MRQLALGVLRARVVRSVVAVLAVAAAVAGVAFAASTRNDDATVARVDCASYQFNEHAWNRRHGHPSPRDRQADALHKCRTLIGMRRYKVRQMLGPPDERDAHEVAYELGPDALGIDSIFLDVQFRHRRATSTFFYQG